MWDIETVSFPVKNGLKSFFLKVNIEKLWSIKSLSVGRTEKKEREEERRGGGGGLGCGVSDMKQKKVVEETQLRSINTVG